MKQTVLCLNAGSSSFKFQLFHADDGGNPELVLKGLFDGIGYTPRLVARDAGQRILTDQSFAPEKVPDIVAALPHLSEFLEQTLEGDLPTVVGHRIVFGGTRYSAPTLIDDACLDYLLLMQDFMPLHLPPVITSIKAVRDHFPELPQVGVFDTGFHSGHDLLRQRLPIPGHLHEKGVQSYGFHGISYEYIARKLRQTDPDLARGRVVVAHLGSGCSMSGMVDGQGVECSFSFSGIGGVMMGTRPGRLDPGVLLYLAGAEGMSVKEIEQMLYRDCGLKGVSGISNDVRELLASDVPSARLALDMFGHSCAGMVAQIASGIGGLDGLVFTAGIGENAPPVRADIGARLAWLGLRIDQDANQKGGPVISTPDSSVTCYVIPTNEELMIARHALEIAGHPA